MQKIKKALPFIVPPVAVALILLINFRANGLYPFGDGTIAWCDMTQQVIPLLADLKDILAGKSGVFLNFANAGGMNLWGVIFFFVASPFSLLVTFVEKTELIHFVNILLILKLMTCSVTSMVYFKTCQRSLPDYFSMIFSVVYALSGYAMLYYQNIIWLDMMYLFPLLLVAFRYMFDRKKILPYTAVLTIMMVVNYYISYMVVVFILLFMGLFCWRYRKDENYRHVPLYFVIGSALAAFLSAVVWLPSFIQYLSSGRTESFLEKISQCGFFTPYQTTIPTVICTISVIAVVAVGVLDGKSRSKKLNTYLIMLFLMLLPLYIEPVNIMWHTGSYMSFPSRFGFITEFLLVACAGFFLANDDKERMIKEKKRCDNIFLLLVCAAAIYFFCVFAFDLVYLNRYDMSAYTRSLWGNDESFHLAIKLGIAAGIVYVTFILLHRKGFISKPLLAILCSVMVVVEAYSSVSVYVTSPNENYPQRAEKQQTVLELSDKIDDDDGFYRVSTSSKLFDVNLVGSMGYNSISHYTSLTSEDYMFMMKRLGYSSYWMEVGSYGGTELTNALMNIKYTISDEAPTENSVYSNDTYTIEPSGYYIPSGLVTDKTYPDGENFPQMTRAEIQQYLYENTIGEKGESLVTEYQCVSHDISKNSKGKYEFKKDEASITVYTYDIYVSGRQSLYFDCFDKTSNELNEPINKSFNIMVNNSSVSSSYPTQPQNGLLYLGEFENEHVNVAVRLLQDCECSSYGVFGIDLDKLENSVSSAKSVNFSADGSKLKGKYTAESGEKCLLSVPYSDTLKITVNGKAVDYSRAFGDLVSFDLEEGENEITVTSVPKGFAAGAVLSLIGIVLCVLYKLFGKKIKNGEVISTALSVFLMGIGIIVLIIIYIMPVTVNILADMRQ